MDWKKLLLLIATLYVAYQAFKAGATDTAKALIKGQRYASKRVTAVNENRIKRKKKDYYPYELEDLRR